LSGPVSVRGQGTSEGIIVTIPNERKLGDGGEVTGWVAHVAALGDLRAEGRRGWSAENFSSLG